MEDAAPPAPAGSRWATIAWIASSAVLVVLVVAFWLRVGDRSAGAELSNAIIEGKRPAAPALPSESVDGTGLPGWYAADGDRQAASARNEVLVVNWWTSWCGDCGEEAPVLERLSRDYEGRVTFVGLNAGEQDLRSDARQFARRYGLTFPLVRGDRGDKDAWGVLGFPETFVVGVDGRISAFVRGEVDERDLRGLLDRELEQDRT